MIICNKRELYFTNNHLEAHGFEIALKWSWAMMAP